MNKIYLYILSLGFACTTSALAQDDVVTEQQIDSITAPEPAEIIAERNYAKERLAQQNEQRSAKNAYTIDQDTTVVLKKFAPNFKKKYKEDESFDYKQELNKSAWQRFKEWINKVLNDFFSMFHTDKKTGENIYDLLKIGGYLVIVVFIYFLVRAYMQKDLQWFFRRKSKDITIEVDEIEKNLDKVNFPTLIADTEKTQDYRLIIRYYYLWLLQQLQEKGHIKWHLEKTNSDYIREIKDDSIRNNFEYLSYIYNNIWYGEHLIGAEEYNKAKKSFDKTLKPTNNE
ncbi:MAG: DUF4129 domain-containing protein [Flavobacteriaceae bacterium]|jgi:hypothetical protein|nr:DUF4129 domain-containing protein [Flavobacteriaceae bacterium]